MTKTTDTVETCKTLEQSRGLKKVILRWFGNYVYRKLNLRVYE